MLDINHLKCIVCRKSIPHFLFLHIDNTGRDEDTALFQMRRNFFLKRDKEQ